jgi:hypothetical protein
MFATTLSLLQMRHAEICIVIPHATSELLASI